MNILCIGHSSYDISLPVDGYPIENTKYRLATKFECGGGPAANAAYLLAKWGINTYIASGMGNDQYAYRIKKEFEEIGLKTEFIELDDELGTSVSFIFINTQNGSRTLFNTATKYHELKNTNFDMNPDIIFLDGHDYNASIKALDKYPNAISIIDAGRVNDNLIDLCKKVDYVVSSKGFAETVSGLKINYSDSDSISGCYNELTKKFPTSTIVVTLEDKGALYMSNNEIKIMPGLNLSPRDTTGAGDIFHGAFTYAVAKKYSLEDTIRISNIAAGLSITKLGARTSIPTKEEVFNYGKK